MQMSTRIIWIYQQKTGDDRGGTFDVFPAGVYFPADRSGFHRLEDPDPEKIARDRKKLWLRGAKSSKIADLRQM